MKKPRLLLIASLPLAVVVIVGLLAMLPERPGVTKHNAGRIRHGMTRAEVIEILGQPILAPVANDAKLLWEHVISRDSGDIKVWESKRGMVWVRFDHEGKATTIGTAVRGETIRDIIHRYLSF